MEGGRARGALLGLAVGDALGTTLEFERPRLSPGWSILDGPHRDVVGGGPFRVAPGQVTDDTHMAICLAASLVERGCFDRDEVTHAYIAWEPHAFDIGALTSAALARAGKDADGGRRAWEQSGRQSAGNGSLMRTAPIGVFLHDDVAARRDASLLDSGITHFDPRCQLACAVFNAAIARAVGSPIAPTAEIVDEAAGLELRAAAELLRNRHPDLLAQIDQAEDELAEDLALARASDPQLRDLIHAAQGFVRVSFRLAFWQLHHAPSFEAGLIDVVNRGGDADTNGAITGALLGALHGDTAIPARWSDVVLEALSDRPEHPLATTYHPRHLLRALERWTAGSGRRPAPAADGDRFFALAPEKQLELVWHALIGEGVLGWEDAVRRAARRLRDEGLLSFERLHESSAAYEEIERLIRKELKTEGVLFDRGDEARGHVRAIVAGPDEISTAGWRNVLTQVLGGEVVERDEAIRLAAQRAREVFGLSFQRLRMDGAIAGAIRTAINSGIRRREISRVGSRRIRRATAEDLSPGRLPTEPDAEAESGDAVDAERPTFNDLDQPRVLEIREVLAFMVPDSFGGCESGWEMENFLAEVVATIVSSDVKDRDIPILIADNRPHHANLSVWVGLPRGLPVQTTNTVYKALTQLGARVEMEAGDVHAHGFRPLLVLTPEAIEVPHESSNLLDETLASIAGTRPVRRRPIILVAR